MNDPLKKQLRLIDLALLAGRKRQSSRTHFVHEEELIPLYDNFCFVLALFRQKTTESVLEGKALLQRLLAFQTAEGNFPIYLHDFPRCFDPHLLLKIAAPLTYLLRLFAPVLGELTSQIEKALSFIKEKPASSPFWENRRRACLGLPLLDFSPEDWTEWVITAQLAGQTHFSLPFDPSLQLFLPAATSQEKEEPKPHAIEWLLSEGAYSPRLLKDHPDQLKSAPLFPLTFEPTLPPQTGFHLFWKGTQGIHSLFAPHLIFPLSGEIEKGKNDLFEALVYCNRSPETQIWIEGCKGTSFRLGDKITIQTPQKTLYFRFELTRGTGDFCGHIFRANRPSQIACKGALQYEAYDWLIGLRTLRRSIDAEVQILFD